MTGNQTDTTSGRSNRPSEGGTPSLVLLRGGRLGQLHALEGETRIGRDESNAIVVELQSVSRQHARVLEVGTGFSVEDLGSRNGTYVNDHAISGETPLRNGDYLQVGDAIFKYLEGGHVESQYHEEIYRLTIIDPLTQLNNKRYLLDFLSREISRASRHGRPLAVVIMDVDHFKGLNDEYGHVAGDYVLRSLSRQFAEQLRREELAARYGGEEFVFVLPETALPAATAFAERLRALVEEARPSFEGHDIRVTASFGVAVLGSPSEPEELIAAADHELYRAKEAGRNRVFPQAP
jgi:diguanylate cyclase (GGDEF)-like protein